MLQPIMNNHVYWNPDEKIIGVIGVAPAATADFYSKLIQLTPVNKDWEHVRVLIDSNPKIPSRGRYLELHETDPVPYMREAIQKLHAAGASIIAIPCNTAHILYDRYATDLDVMIPNMIEATTDYCITTCNNIPQAVAVFASRLTQQHGLYEQVFARHGGKLIDTSAHQAEISALIEAVKQGKSLTLLKERMHAVLSAYPQADAFVLGCTEISLLTDATFNGIPIIDSNVALARACLALSGNNAFASHA